jgi:hypothetical protein
LLPQPNPPTHRVIYVLDSSVLIDIKNGYPINNPLFSGIWQSMAEMATDGRLISPHEAFRELRKGMDEAAEWAAVHKHMFVEMDQEQASIVTEIWTKCPEIDKDIARPHADPWCVALAIRHQRSTGSAAYVVSNENKKSPRKIPVICDKFAVQCIKMLEFFMHLSRH